MDQIVLGPYVTRRAEPVHIDRYVESTGCNLEFATASHAYELRIFRCNKHSTTRSPDFEDFGVLEADIPFTVECFDFQVKELPGGPYIALSAFLTELYQRYEGLTPIKRFFADFAKPLPFQDFFYHSEDAINYPLRGEVAREGYIVRSVLPYGRRILVYFGWTVPTQADATTPAILSVGSADFRPRPDQTLGSGRWIPPRKKCIDNLLFSDLFALSNATPANLLTDDAESRMLREFDWTPLALMTQKQAPQARIEFIRRNVELASDAKQLARALKDARLYSEETSLSQIRKSLPSLMKATQKGG